MATALIIAHDIALQRQMFQMLTKLGYKVYDARAGNGSGSTVLKFKPDLVFIHLTLPIETGYMASDRLRRQGYSGQIILMSAFYTLESTSSALVRGANGFLLEPITLDSLYQFRHEKTASQDRSVQPEL